MFQNDSTFKSNWSGIVSSDVNTSIENYINNVILKIFNIQRSMVVKLYKIEDENGFSVEYNPVESLEGWSLMSDFKTEMNVQNEDLMLTVTFMKEDKTKVHPVIEIYR